VPCRVRNRLTAPTFQHRPPRWRASSRSTCRHPYDFATPGLAHDPHRPCLDPLAPDDGSHVAISHPPTTTWDHPSADRNRRWRPGQRRVAWIGRVQPAIPVLNSMLTTIRRRWTDSASPPRLGRGVTGTEPDAEGYRRGWSPQGGAGSKRGGSASFEQGLVSWCSPAMPKARQRAALVWCAHPRPWRGWPCPVHQGRLAAGEAKALGI